MWTKPKIMIALLAAVPMMAAAGCATQDEVNTLKGELQDVKAIATQAAADAKKAATDAQTASDKANRILRESLRK